MGTLASLVVRVGADISNFTTDMNRASKISKKNSDAILKSVKRIGVGVAAGLAVAVNEAAKFETAMAEVATLLDDTSGIDGLTKSVRQLSIEYGKAPVETAKALYQIISAGAADAESQMLLLHAANKLAIGGITDVETAADGLTGVLNAYGFEAKEAGRISDVMFTTMKLGKTTIAELSAKVNEITPLASTLGISFEEVGAALAAVTAITGNTSTATTQLKAVLSAIIAPAEKSKKLWADMEIEFGKAGIAAKNGLLPFLQELIEKTGGNDAKLKKMLGSVEALQAVLALATGDFGGFSDALDRTNNALGATDEAVATVSKTFKFQMDKMNATISVLVETIGTSLLPSLNTFATAVLDLTTPVKTFDESVDDAKQSIEAMDELLDSGGSSNDFANAIQDAASALKAIEHQTGKVNREIQDNIAFFGEDSKIINELKAELDDLWSQQKILNQTMIAGNEVLEDAAELQEVHVTATKRAVAETITWAEWQEKLRKAHSALLAELDPLGTAAKNYAETIKSLGALLNGGLLSQQQFNTGVAHAAKTMEDAKFSAMGLDTELEEIIVTAKKVPNVAKNMGTSMSGAAALIENSFKRLDDVFANFWSNLLKNGKFSLKGIKDLFLDTIAQMLHAAITQPIVLKIGAIMTGGLASGAASAAGASFGTSWLSGFVDMIGGPAGAAAIGIGSALGYTIAGGSTVAEGLGAAIGGTALGIVTGAYGAIIGGPLGQVIGTAVGSLVGGILGSLVGSLFGSKPKITIGGSNTGGDGGTYFDSDLGGFKIGAATKKLKEQADEFANAIIQMDNAIAGFLTGAQIDKVTDALKDWRERLKGEAISLETMLESRFAVILAQFGDNVRAYVDTFEGLEDQSNALQAYVTAMNALSVTLMGFIDTKAVSQFSEEVLNSSDQMAQVSNDLSDAFANFNNTPEELININRLVQARYQQEIEFLTAIDALIDRMSQSIDTQRKKILDMVREAEGLEKPEIDIAETSRAAVALLDSIRKASSIEEISLLVSQAQRMTQTAFDAMSDAQKIAEAEGILDFLSQLESTATKRAQKLAEDMMTDGEMLREQAKMFGEKFDISLSPVVESNESITNAVDDQTAAVVEAMNEQQQLQRINNGYILQLLEAIKGMTDTKNRTDPVPGTLF